LTQQGAFAAGARFEHPLSDNRAVMKAVVRIAQLKDQCRDDLQ
jgi:hypothetical protein